MSEMQDGRVRLFAGDCREVLKGIADASVDACVTDPPYALVSISKRFSKSGRTDTTVSKSDAHQRFARGFMGKSWDNEETAFAAEFWAEVLRVLKPGGHVLAFGGTRTCHLLTVAMEDGGFEVRDRFRMDESAETKYGPLWKSLDADQQGALLELLNDQVDHLGSELAWVFGSGFPKSHNQHGDWEGYGTALKPAYEPIIVGRKPIDGTNAANLAKWGVGCLNIDGCRVETEDGYVDNRVTQGGKSGGGFDVGSGDGTRNSEFTPSTLGRWPANLIHDGSDEVIGAFPQAPGQMADASTNPETRKNQNVYGEMRRVRAASEPSANDDNEGAVGFKMKPGARRLDSGSAARFFYAAKASRADRDAGLEHLPKKAAGIVSETSGQHITRRDEGYVVAPRANTHPTVKPTTLMQYLCRLVTPPGGIVLDPFMGSGSTGKAAVLEGFQFVGIEREAEYMPIAEARIAWAIAEIEWQGEGRRPVSPMVDAEPPANDNQQPDIFAAGAS